jgi:hypothetical protein
VCTCASLSYSLLRYSAAIERLTYITTWWKQLSDVEQANTANLHKLIMSCEGEVEREREAWLSTSMATKMLAEAGAGEPEKREGDGEASADKASAASAAAQ